LRAQVLLDRHREVGAALDGGVVGHDHHLLAHHPADAADHAGRGGLAVVHLLGRERRDLEEGRGRVEQGDDAVAHQQLAAGDVLAARLLAAAVGGTGQAAVEFGDQRTVEVGVVAEFLRTRIEFRGDGGHPPIVGAKKDPPERVFLEATEPVAQSFSPSMATSASCAASLVSAAAWSAAAETSAAASWVLPAISLTASPVAAAAASAPCSTISPVAEMASEASAPAASAAARA